MNILPRDLSDGRHTFLKAENAKELTERLIERGRVRSVKVVEDLMREANERQDYLVPGNDIRFKVPYGKTPELWARIGADDEFIFTNHARNAALRELHIPTRFFDGLVADKDQGIDIAEELVNDLRYRFGSRRLLRVVGGHVKGFLSEGYNPIDQQEIIATFMDALKATDAIPVDGEITEWRYGLTAIGGQPFAGMPDEWLIQAIQLRSSDYGLAAVTLQEGWYRLICTNLAAGAQMYRQVHLGKTEWSVEESFKISDRTQRLAAQAAVSAMSDAIRGAFNPERQERILRSYVEAADAKINVGRRAEGLKKDGILRAAEAAQVVEMVQGNQAIEVLPRSTTTPETALRFSAALSWLANGATGDHKLELQDAAADAMLVR